MSTHSSRQRLTLLSISSGRVEPRLSLGRQRCLTVELLEARTLLTGLAWSTGPAMPAALGYAAALDIGSGVLLLGGATSIGGATTPSNVYLFDPYANTWGNATPADQGRSGAGVGRTGSPGPIVTSGGETNYKYTSDIFQFGGANQSHALATASNYDPSPGGESTVAPAMSTARDRLAYATDPATGDLYAIGGLGSAGSALSSVERYDPQADAWSTIAALPQARYGASAVNDGAGHILVFGGANSAGALVNTVYSYTIANNTWSSVAPMPQAASGTAAVYGAYGQIYVIGGLTTGGAVSDVRVYNPVTDQWTAEAPLPSAEYGAAAAIDSNGSLDVIGGFNSANSAVARLYHSIPLPAPDGLPTVPNITISSDYWIYDGMPHGVTAAADVGDGVTPVDGEFSITYNGSATPPVNVGTYNVVVTFTSHDPNFVSTVKQDTLTIDPAMPTLNISGGGTIAYDGQPHGITAVAVGADGSTTVNGSVTYSYNGVSSLPVNPGTYTAIANFTSLDANYTSASASATITIPDPTIPTGVTAMGASTNSIRVSWNPVAGAAYYNIYERHVVHSPRGSGSTIYYSIDVGGITGTSATITVSQVKGYTYYVTSVGATGVESSRSTPATGEPLFAPSLYSMLWGGAVTSYASVEVGQTLQVTLLGNGNEPPTYTMTNGPSTMTVDPTTGIVTYTPASSEAGIVSASFQASNSLGTATATFQFHVLAQPVIAVTGGTFLFDGNTHSASAVALASDGVTPINGTFSYTYSPTAYPTAMSTAPYAQAGTYIVHVTFTSSDPNYGSETGTSMITIDPATPTILLEDAVVDYDGAAQAVLANVVGIDGVTPVAGTFAYTYNGSSTPPTNPGVYAVVARFMSSDPNYTNGSATAALIINPAANSPATVADRKLFYANSVFDGYSGNPATAHDEAIAPDKVALLPGGGESTFSNISSYAAGINGIMVDLTAGGNHAALAVDVAADFTFKVSGPFASNSPNNWSTLTGANLPTVTVRQGAGSGGSDRVQLVWPSGKIVDTWLEVIVRAGADSGLTADDVFFFGSLPGDSGNDTDPDFRYTDTLDESAARVNSTLANADLIEKYGLVAAITNPWDFNRDNNVDALDQAVSRSYASFPYGELDMISIAAAEPFAPATGSNVGGDAGIASAIAMRTDSTSDRGIPFQLANYSHPSNVDRGQIADLFGHLALQDVPRDHAIQKVADQFADTLGLDKELIEELITELGLR